jgi:hypothetical protein
MTLVAKVAVSVATILIVLPARAEGAGEDFGKPQLSCGSYCLYIAMKSLDLPVANYQTVEAKIGQPGSFGYSMDQLAVTARSFGAHVEGVEISLDALQRIPGRFSCIALLDKGHFVNIAEIADGRVFVIDAPNSRSVAADAFRVIWGGKALLISDRPLEIASKGMFSGGRLIVTIIAVVVTVILVILLLLPVFKKIKWHFVVIMICFTFISCKKDDRVISHSMPSLEVNPTSIDLGTGLASSNGELKAMVSIKNLGTGPLRIVSVRSSCGCTVISPPHSNLDPNQADRFDVTVKVGLQAGPRNSTVTIDSNDPIHPSLTIPVQWRAEPLISIDPDKIDFGAVRPGEKLKRIIAVRPFTSDVPPSLEARCSRPEITLTWDGVPGKERQLMVDMVAGPDPGDQSGMIILSNGNTELASAVPARWHVKAKLSATPASLFSAEAEPGKMIERRLIILSEDRPFQIKSVKIDDGMDINPSVQDQNKSSNKEHAVVVRIIAPKRTGIHRKIVRIITDLGDEYQLAVPWSIVVK